MAKREAKRATPPAPQGGESRGGEELPAEVQAAIEELNQEPASVIEFKVYTDKVTLVLFDYRKYTFSLPLLAARIKKRLGR